MVVSDMPLSLNRKKISFSFCPFSSKKMLGPFFDGTVNNSY